MMTYKIYYIIVTIFFITSVFDGFSQTTKSIDNDRYEIEKRERQDSLLEARKIAISNEFQSEILGRSSDKNISISAFTVQTANALDLDLERAILIELYDSLGGDGWRRKTNWKSELPIEQWYGVTVDADGYVISLTLSSNTLVGTMPEEIGQFSRLQTLTLSFNRQLILNTWTNIADLVTLEYLELSSTNIITRDMSPLSNLSNLEYLALASNNLGDDQLNSFPEDILSLSTLSHLDLSFNNFTGKIPENIGVLINMEYLYLHYNSFNDTLPSSIGTMTQLMNLDLRSNNLLGPIPDSFRNLTNLESFTAWDNSFNSDIPDIFADMDNLEILYLTNCGLTGNFPQSIQYLYSVYDLDLSDNQITGNVPDLSDLPLIWLSLNNNLLEGTFPNITDNYNGELNLSNNSFSGEIPAGLYYNGQGTNHLFGNKLTHTILVPYLREVYARGSVVCWPQDSVEVSDIPKAIYGQPYSLEVLIDRDPTLECEFQWFKYVDGENDIALQPEFSDLNHTYNFDNFHESDTGLYYFHIINSEDEGYFDWQNYGPYYEVVSKLIRVTGEYPECSEFPIDFDHFPAPTCGVLFTPQIENENDCDILSYHWDFGDGDSSVVQEPHHVYNSLDTFNVTMTVTYECPEVDFCGVRDSSITKQIDLRESIFDSLITITVETKLIDSVLNASSATFTDSWYVPYDNELLRKRNPYLNGSKGVWRNNANYIYREDRQASSSVNVSLDGTYPLESFNWPMAQYEAIPGWLKSNTVTQYSPYSFELENQDILGNYSAAIYGYGGQMPVAVGQNMANEEMAYTGFEELDSDGFAIVHDASRRGSGNWSLSIDDQKPFTKVFEVKVGYGNLALMNEPMESFEGIDTVSILAIYITEIKFAFATFPLINFKRLDDVAIWCKESYGEFDENTILTFDQVIHNELWYGNIIYTKPAKKGIVSDVSKDIAHTGTKSLKITENKVISQEYLELVQGKEYILSAWASINDKHLYVPVLGENLGIRMQFYDSADALIHNVLLEPSGNIIEGWQKIEKKFMYPEGAVRFETSFEKGTAPILYLDDLRLFPAEGNMQSYVYELNTYRLRAVMDENNYASLYYYDPEGNLYLVKKETEEGLMAIQESTGYQMQTGGE